VRSRLLFVALATACGRVSFDPTMRDGGDGVGNGGDGGDASGDRPNVAFITSTTHTGALGGVTGADDICQTRADAVGLTGTFVSLLRDSTRGHVELLAGSRGWVDVTGVPIADLPEDWFGSAMFYPLTRDEAGTLLPGGRAVFTGNTETCFDWTSPTLGDLGGIVSTNEAFSDFSNASCGIPRPLPCAELGHVADVRPPPAVGRDAFISQATFVPGGGLTAADILCASEANNAGLSGSFRALLADATTSAAGRFSLAGLPWRRTDGVLLADTPAGLFDPAQRRTFLPLTATGAARGFVNVWRGDDVDHCNGWMSTAPMGRTAAPTTMGTAFELVGTAGCGSGYPLVCLQE
jgi:hypothetical protein